MLLLPIIILIFAILIDYIVAKKFEEIATMKGHTNVSAFAMCFWLGIVGYLYVIALPNLTNNEKETQKNEESSDSFSEF